MQLVRELWPDFDPRWVVYQDAAVLVIDKPAGIASQAADPQRSDDLPARVRRFVAAQRGVAPDQVYVGVHQRLDQDTSGLMLLSLQPEANAALAQQFEQRRVDKRYVACVQGGRLATCTRGELLEHRLGPRRRGRVQVVPDSDREGREARVRVQPLARRDGRALLELTPQTGRTHQLRVQLADAGSPIAGDRLYGGAAAVRLMLHAAGLGLRHPLDGRALEFERPPPFEFDAFVAHGNRDVLDEPRLLRRALDLAVARRGVLGRLRQTAEPTTAFRLFHEEADGSRALALDLYLDHAVVHLFGEPNELPTDAVLDAVADLGFAGVYLKCHPRQKNELVDARRSAYAPTDPVRGVRAPDELVVHEHGVPFEVCLGDGLRTGLFLDQRDNRMRVRALSAGKRVLNLFAYTGGFSVAALAGGATSATCVDVSVRALQWGSRNVARIGASDRHRFLQADAFDALSRMERRGERFDLVVLDPPSYAKTRSRRFVASKDYAVLARACLRVLAPGGQLLACINHHGTTQAKLRRDVGQAASESGHGRVQVKDIPAGVDFPAAFGTEPGSKSVLATCD